jgi:hypothetical protein
MTDDELCGRLRISKVTLRKYLRIGPPRRRKRNSGDIRLISHIMLGSMRRWHRDSVEKFIRGDI